LDWTQKLDTDLRTLSESARNGRAPSTSDAQSVGVTADRGQLRVIVETVGGNTPSARGATRNAASSVGGRVEGEYANLVQVLIAPERVIDLAADTRVR
jgi:hypothetical protein